MGGALGYAVEGLERMKIDYEKTRSGQALVQDAIERGVFVKGGDGVVYGPFPLSSMLADKLKAGLQEHLRTVVRGE